jgi:hypothetical protein
MTALGVHDGDFKHFDSGVSAVTLAGGCTYHRMIPATEGEHAIRWFIYDPSVIFSHEMQFKVHTHQHKQHTTMCYPSCLVFEHYHYFISISNYQLMLQSSVWNPSRRSRRRSTSHGPNVHQPPQTHDSQPRDTAKREARAVSLVDIQFWPIHSSRQC